MPQAANSPTMSYAGLGGCPDLPPKPDVLWRIRDRLEHAVALAIEALDAFDGDSDLELESQDEGAQCEDEGAACEDEGSYPSDCEPPLGWSTPGSQWKVTRDLAKAEAAQQA